ncbi:3-oxoacyl-ACP reductase FabG [Helicobacter apodemus]|uniref:3-oxoacyl-[acyl-carrier-protein] reductase n=1 Tax=Helicobacter apodemus TaxID=135569 RepID=A0A2U8FCG7_9HELI|nr:3-oxoacyl-ACP reductase FabG [Helicobacter apodemus]AWI33909.1 3-oxoacyl-[acyl-carrier-protein] reductase [Helicobacter apodemus]
MKFYGKNVLITGSSKGIGADIARLLAQMGLKVWINYRSKPEVADSLKNAIEKQGGKAAVICFDATNEAQFIEALALITNSDGELGYLVNNAGITNDKLSMRMKVEEFNAVLDANLLSCFIGCKEVLKIMRKQGYGSVVNIASIIGEIGNIGQCNYAASKGGMIAMTKSFAKEGGSKKIRFNCVTPGFIQSDMTNKLKEEIQQSYIANIPLGCFGSGEEVAGAVAFLLSDYANYITGEVLKVNGGLYM